MFEALYPCGSITGAPKRRTMQLLQQLETAPRRLYTGAIGWFEATVGDCNTGDFTLSVPIRTLLLDAPGANDLRGGEMGVGAGIVYDSDASAEYQECLLKARFLTGVAPGFALFETMHVTREGCRYLDRHLARLSMSAEQLGFACDASAIRTQVSAACAALAPGQGYRLRLALDAAGNTQLRSAAITPLQEPVRLLLSPVVMRSDDTLLAHKTTLRRVYDEGWQRAERVGAFDALFFNERGELTEGGRSNVLVKLDGQWCTPPLASGLLPGVMRSVLLDDPAWGVQQRVITLADLHQSDEIRVCNALRGVLQAVLD
jgi:para-aminobenzoate synthetase/4-amino-4-deoxychorismate lyase